MYKFVTQELCYYHGSIKSHESSINCLLLQHEAVAWHTSSREHCTRPLYRQGQSFIPGKLEWKTSSHLLFSQLISDKYDYQKLTRTRVCVCEKKLKSKCPSSAAFRSSLVQQEVQYPFDAFLFRQEVCLRRSNHHWLPKVTCITRTNA